MGDQTLCLVIRRNQSDKDDGRIVLKDNTCQMLLAALAKPPDCQFVSSSLGPEIEIVRSVAKAVSCGAGQLDLSVQGVVIPGECWSLVAVSLDASCSPLIPPRVSLLLCRKQRPSNASLLIFFILWVGREGELSQSSLEAVGSTLAGHGRQHWGLNKCGNV